MALSEQKGVLDGGSVVHVIGRPPEAEGPVRTRPGLDVLLLNCVPARLFHAQMRPPV